MNENNFTSSHSALNSSIAALKYDASLFSASESGLIKLHRLNYTNWGNTLYNFIWNLISQTLCSFSSADLQRRQEPGLKVHAAGISFRSDSEAVTAVRSWVNMHVMESSHWKWFCDPLSGADPSVENHRLNTLLMTFLTDVGEIFQIFQTWKSNHSSLYKWCGIHAQAGLKPATLWFLN